MFRKDLFAHLGLHGRRRGHRCAVGAHDFPAEGLLLIGAFDHIYFAVQSKVGACHGKGRSPLAGSGLSSHAFESLFLRIIRLGNGRVQFVAAAGVIALELVVDPRRRLKLLFQAVGADQRRRTVHLVKIMNLLRDLKERRIVIQLLPDQLLTEDA